MAHGVTATIVSTDVNFNHRIQVGKFQLTADEPVALGGQGAGPAPYDYYLAALCACTAITLRMYAQRKGWELGDFKAELSFTKDAEGKAHIHRVLHASGPLTDAQWSRLLEVVANTPVTKTMREGAEITSERGAAAA